MRALLDINVLIALLDASHVFHQRAHAWWAANMNSGWASCAITENGVVRIMSQTAFRPSQPLTTISVFNALKRFTSHTNHEFWADMISIRDGAIFDHSHIHGPKQLTDIYLLALAVAKQGCLATFDSGITVSAVKGASQSNIHVI